MRTLKEVRIEPRSIDRLTPVVGGERVAQFKARAERARADLAGRIVWNVNSTASGGGVAEMLQVVLAYALGAGIDTRWAVIEGDPRFFAVTKRLHNRLHGAAGDGRPLSAPERAVYDEVIRANRAPLAELVRAGDVVILHDPQTAGLSAPMRDAGATVVWRCHVGVDDTNDHVEEAWAFLRPYVEPADAFVFSRQAHVHQWMPADRVAIIPPSIDPLAPKNQPLDAATVRSILGRIGFLEPAGGPAPTFERRDGTAAVVAGTASFPRRGERPPPGVPVVAQVSRWDRLKDMAGVLRAFADHVGPPAHLALVGPSVDGVADDPEGAEVLAECVALYDACPPDVQARVHLVSLPVDDGEENAAMVNALQRHAAVVTQKSLQEGFGLTVTEAMIKARPIVASGVGGIQDQIRNEREGLLIPDPCDLRAFGAALNRMLSDPAAGARMGEAARARAIAEFVGDRHLTRYADLLGPLADREPG